MKKNERAMLLARQEKGLPVPMLDNWPDLDHVLNGVLTTYWRLRNSTAADCPVAYRDKLAVYERDNHGMDENTFLGLLGACDSEYAEFRAEQLDRESRKRRKDAAGRGGPRARR